MLRDGIKRASAAAALLVSLLLPAPQRSQGQTCRGDIDGDGQVTPADLALAVSIVSGELVTPAQKVRADVNGDGVVTAADIVMVVQLQGPCSARTATPSFARTLSPTPTPSPTLGGVSPTKSPTATPPRATPTVTRTRPPTPTSTPTCIVVAAPFGTTNGTLTADDCQQLFGNKLRHTDVYSITGTPGQSITVQLAATGPSPIVPYVAVVDPDGQFGEVLGAPPIQFVVSSSQPYEILVASAPSAAQELGPYQLTLTQTACPAPVALAIGANVKSATLSATDCPDPGAPSIGAYLNPAHIYTFPVSSVPLNIAIVMKQLSEDDDITPAFSVLNPDGIELVTQDNNWDCTSDTSDLVCSQAWFLALQTGTYTIIAAGGTGRYSLQLFAPSCKVTAWSNIPSAPPTPCSTTSGPGCVVGSLSGKTSCAAPLPIPGISDDEPADPSSPADLYTFTAAAGDVISASMVSDDDAHLYLLGPAPGNQLVAQDDDSLGDQILSFDSQLAATLVQPGTYTIVAANNYGLYPDDDPVNYTLQVQKCPVYDAVPVGGATALYTRFTNSDCVGFGGVPYRTYSFVGTAGEFVAVGMTSADVDAVVRMFGPDGSVVENDDDLLASSDTTDAQVNRILPVNGTYFVEASTYGGVDTTPFSSPPAFIIQAQTCPKIPGAPGTISAAFADADCQATDGTPFDVFAFTPAAAPSAASVVAPSGGCLIALLAEGAQTPDSGCITGTLDFPNLSNSTYGFIIAATDPATRGPYTVQLAECPLSLLTFGDVRSGSLAPGDCHAADGTPADWFLVKAAADLVRFNPGVSGTVTTSFAPANVLTDMSGPSPLAGRAFGEDDPTLMYPFGTDYSFGTALAALLRVAGDTPAAQGTYTVSIDPASLRQ